jgi:hypothetical protein
MGKINCPSVEQLHFELNEVTENLALVRDSIRECGGRWRAAVDMADLILERDFQRLNDLMRGISDGFQGISFRPVTTSKYSTLKRDGPKRAR